MVRSRCITYLTGAVLLLAGELTAQEMEPVAGMPLIVADTAVAAGVETSFDTARESVVTDGSIVPGEEEEGSEKKGGDTGEEHPRLTPSEYLYAEAPRRTVDGSMPFRQTHIRPIPFAITVGTLSGILTGIHLYQQDAWWKDRRTDFHFAVDWGYAAQADKLGHMFAAYYTSYFGHEALVASGFSPETAGWLGPLLALGFQTYVEIEDGFSPFGFDPTDQYANTIGALFSAAQNYIEPLQNVKMKWSYWPTDALNTGATEGHQKIVIDDYNGQAVWLSFKMGNILPESLKWPKWLRLAFGYGAYNVDQWDESGNLLMPGRRLFISLDYDLVELVPDIGGFGNWVVQTLDLFHLPAPAFQIAPEPTFFLMYPIEF